jgi:hypothetical protein
MSDRVTPIPGRSRGLSNCETLRSNGNELFNLGEGRSAFEKDSDANSYRTSVNQTC